MHFRRIFLLLTILLLTLSNISEAQQKGMEALEKGDYETALKELRPLAEGGNAEAQMYLGLMYANGNGVDKNDSISIDWLKKAAAQRNTRAMGLLSTQLFSRHDLIHAYVWSHLAAESDPIQFATATRFVIEKYCTEDQIIKAKKIMDEWKAKWKNEPKTR